jgi:hypothetical protein
VRLSLALLLAIFIGAAQFGISAKNRNAELQRKILCTWIQRVFITYGRPILAINSQYSEIECTMSSAHLVELSLSNIWKGYPKTNCPRWPSHLSVGLYVGQIYTRQFAQAVNYCSSRMGVSSLFAIIGYSHLKYNLLINLWRLRRHNKPNAKVGSHVGSENLVSYMGITDDREQRSSEYTQRDFIYPIGFIYCGHFYILRCLAPKVSPSERLNWTQCDAIYRHAWAAARLTRNLT